VGIAQHKHDDVGNWIPQPAHYNIFLDLIHDTYYNNQTNRRKAGIQHKRIKFPVLKWAIFLVMETVRVHTLYPPFGCNQNN
jgi:hypothetical protein